MAQADLPNASVWQSLRAWVDSREALEREKGVSAITPDEANIISSLTATVVDEPDIDESNYISSLGQYAQQRHYELPDYSKEENIPPGTRGGGGKWRVFCKLPWCNEVFPQAGHGFPEGQQAPAFSSKKAAKKFAAKMAMEHIQRKAASAAANALQDRAASPAIIETTDSGSVTSPPPKRAKVAVKETETDQTTTTAAEGPKLASSNTASEAKDDLTGSGGSSVEDKKQQKHTMQAMVLDLALTLNIKTPTYITSPEADRPGFFKGFATWRKEPSAPEEPFRVEGVFGEAQATEQLAARVYEWLVTQREGRAAEFASIMAGIARTDFP